jgi:hypothetical protein
VIALIFLTAMTRMTVLGVLGVVLRVVDLGHGRHYTPRGYSGGILCALPRSDDLRDWEPGYPATKENGF